tara:strand:- start:990 stop:1352 length:363 start_codon:yes stop_codon:yes gene_type:complete
LKSESKLRAFWRTFRPGKIINHIYAKGDKMKLTKRKLRQIIQESMQPPQYSATEIFMDIMRRGGPDRYVALAHGRPGMKCTDFMHYQQALRAYIDTEAPHLKDMPNNVWNDVCYLLSQVD